MYKKPVSQKITSEVDLNDTEEITEIVNAEEVVTEETRTGKAVTENAAGISDTSENIYTDVFKQFKKLGSQQETIACLQQRRV